MGFRIGGRQVAKAWHATELWDHFNWGGSHTAAISYTSYIFDQEVMLNLSDLKCPCVDAGNELSLVAAVAGSTTKQEAKLRTHPLLNGKF